MSSITVTSRMNHSLFRSATSSRCSPYPLAATKHCQRRLHHSADNVQFSSSSPKVLRPIYVAATRQHTGKTTVCLALMSGLRKRFPNVGFMKPIGQQSLEVKTSSSTKLHVDKDVVVMKERFHLNNVDYAHMSPIIIHRGYVKNYIDGKIAHQDQVDAIRRAFIHVNEANDVVLCEGTGHVAVGSVVGLNNAQVAKLLGCDMVLVTNGGIGSAFDELELNRLACERYGVRIAGVIINKVKTNKFEQTKDYISRALKTVHLPLLGYIPDRPSLGCVALADLEKLFDAKLISGEGQRMKHYRNEDMKLVQVSDISDFQEIMRSNPPRTIYFVHSSRDDIVMAFLEENEHRRHCNQVFEAALMICSDPNIVDLSNVVRDKINNGQNIPPIMCLPVLTQEAISMINDYTPKMNADDSNRVAKAIEHYEPYIDFEQLLERTKVVDQSVDARG